MPASMDIDYCSNEMVFQDNAQSKDSGVIHNSNLSIRQKLIDERSTSSLKKRFVLFTDQSDDEKEDDSSFSSFSTVKTSPLLAQEAEVKPEASSRYESEESVSISNDFYSCDETDEETYSFLRSVNKVNMYEPKALVIGKRSPSEVEANVLGDRDVENLRLLEIELLKGDESLPDTSKAGEKTSFGEKLLRHAAIELVASVDDHESRSHSSIVEKEVFLSSKQGVKVSKWSDSQRIGNHFESSNYCARCVYCGQNLSTINYDFPSYSTNSNIPHKVNDELGIIHENGKKGIDGCRTTLHRNRDNSISESNLDETINDSVLKKKFSTEKLYRNEMMRHVKAKSLMKSNVEKLSSCKTCTDMILTESKNLATTSLSDKYCTSFSTQSTERESEMYDDYEYVRNSDTEKSLNNLKYATVFQKTEAIEKSLTPPLHRSELGKLTDKNPSKDLSLLELQEIAVMQNDKEAIIVEDLTTTLKLRNSLAPKPENKNKSAIQLAKSGNEFINEFNELAVIKTEIESDDTDPDCAVDVLHFMLLKEIWCNKGPFETDESDLERDEVFISLLQEFLSKRNSNKYISQLIGIDKFIKEHNIHVAKNNLEDNIETGKGTCLLQAHQFPKETTLANSPAKTNCDIQIIDSNVPDCSAIERLVEIVEQCLSKTKSRSTKISVSKNERKVNSRNGKSDGKSDFSKSAVLRRNKKVDLDSKRKNLADQKTAKERDKRNITTSLEKMSTIPKTKCGENSRHRTSVKCLSSKNVPLPNMRQLNNNSTISGSQCSSSACDFMKSERLRHFNDLCFQPFVKLEKINLEDFTCSKQRSKPPVLKHTCTRTSDISKTDQSKRRNSENKQENITGIVGKLRGNGMILNHEKQQRISTNKKDENFETKRATQKLNQIFETDSRKRSKRLIISKLCYIPLERVDQSIPKLGNISQIPEKTNSTFAKMVATQKRAQSSDHFDSDENYVPNKKRRVKVARQHSYTNKIKIDESISRRSTSQFSTTAETTLASKRNTNQHSFESLPVKRKRGRPPNEKNLVKQALKCTKSLTHQHSYTEKLNIDESISRRSTSKFAASALASEQSTNQYSSKCVPVKRKRDRTPKRKNPVKQELKCNKSLTCQHSYTEKLDIDESISRRSTSKFSATALAFEQSTNQHSSKNVPVKRNRGKPPKGNNVVKQKPKGNKSLTKSSVTMQLGKLYFSSQKKTRDDIKNIGEDYSQNPPRISKQYAKFKNVESKEKCIKKEIENLDVTSSAVSSLTNLSVNRQQIEDENIVLSVKDDSKGLSSNGNASKKQDDKNDVDTLIKPDDVLEISPNDEAMEIRKKVNENPHNELYRLYFANFLTSNGHKVKIHYVSGKVVILAASIRDVDEAESFVKIFSRFDCANYLPWRDCEREKYILYRTWLCGTNGSQEPDVNNQNLLCQAKIHISIKRSSANEFNAHVLIYMEHTHNSINNKRKNNK